MYAASASGRDADEAFFDTDGRRLPVAWPRDFPIGRVINSMNTRRAAHDTDFALYGSIDFSSAASSCTHGRLCRRLNAGRWPLFMLRIALLRHDVPHIITAAAYSAMHEPQRQFLLQVNTATCVSSAHALSYVRYRPYIHATPTYYRPTSPFGNDTIAI